MEINFPLILALGIISMLIGAIWYGPIFGKHWLKLQGANPKQLPTQSQMIPLYLIQFISTLFLIFVIYVFTKPANHVMPELHSALWLFAGIALPILTSATIWTSHSPTSKAKILLIQSGYTLILFTIIGYTIQNWG